MITNRLFLLLAMAICSGCPVYAENTTDTTADEIAKISVTNTLDIDRKNETVSIDLSSLNSLPNDFVVRDSGGNEIPHQTTYDNKLIFQVSLPAGSERTYVIEPGLSSPADTLVYGRLFPERLDDFAWENDKSAYRCYGPAFQANGSIGYGYDVWTKSVPYPILESRYHNDLNHIHSYHQDDGTGMDVYDVGASLGAGATALCDSNKIIFPTCFEKCEILDNGPVRFTVRFSMYPNSYKDKKINETRTISLDKGAFFNKTEVTYDTDMMPESVVAGISVKEAAKDSYIINSGQGFVSYEDPTDNPHSENGVIYLALIAAEPDSAEEKIIPVNEKRGSTTAHLCLDFKFRNNSKYHYYWGGCWNKTGIADLESWNKLVEHQANIIRNPLIIKLSK